MTDPRAWRLAAAIAGAAVTGSGTVQPPFALRAGTEDRALPEDRWRALMTMVETERLTGALAVAADSGSFAVTSEQAEESSRAHRRAMATALLLDRTLLDVAQMLAHHDLSFVVLKGSAAAHLDYATPSLRSYGDVDLLVEGDRMDDARRVLEAAGAVRRYPQRQDDFDRRFTKSVTLRMPNDVEIDLHRTLAPGPFGLTIDLTELASSLDGFVLGARLLPALGGSRRFVHACYHATLGRARTGLVPLCDVVATAPQDEWALHEVDGLVRHWACQAVVRRALDVAMGTLGWTPGTRLREWRDELRADRRTERWLAAYTGAERSDRRLALYSVQALPRLRERVAYGSALARSSVAARYVARRIVRSARAGGGGNAHGSDRPPPR